MADDKPKTLVEISESLKREQQNLFKKMINGLIQSHKHKSSSSWFIYCLYYMELLRTIVNIIPNPTKEDKESTNFDPKKAIIVPYFYNFRHTLELLLKFIFVSIEEKIEPSHDILKILNSITDKKIKLAVDIKQSALDLAISEDKVKEIIEKKHIVITELVEKYFFQFHLLDKLSPRSFIIVDEKNELYRYPETNCTIQINPLYMYDLAKDDRVVSELKDDFKKLESCLSFFSVIFKK